MAARKFRRNGDKRDGTQFVALPLVVLESPGYRLASHPARSLLIDIAMQYTGHNNGKLTACAKYLRAKGWKSNDTIVSARRELVECGLLIETRKGGFPNTTSWFALSWYDLDQTQGLDIDPKLYRRGWYMHPDKPTAKSCASLVPAGGATRLPVRPAGGAGGSIAAPAGGAIRVASGASPTPADGAYLETPSALAVAAGVER